MKHGLSDTPPEIERVRIQGYRKMSPAEKMARVAELNDAIRHLALARIRSQYGDIPEAEQRLRLAALRLDRQTMVRVFGWDPEKEGY